MKNKIKSVIHPFKRGITVAIPVENPFKVGYKLKKDIKVNSRSIITICPLYERINANAVCLELKNLDIRCLNLHILKKMVQIINKYIN
jgi:hypothetical protein